MTLSRGNNLTSATIGEVSNNESNFEQNMDNIDVMIGRCCIGELCKYKSQAMMLDQHCTICDGNIHYNCAIFNGSDCICKKCYALSMPKGCQDSNTCSVPNLSETISRGPILLEALNALNRTNINGNTHKACVCVVCDSFIIEIEKFNGYQR